MNFHEILWFSGFGCKFHWFGIGFYKGWCKVRKLCFLCRNRRARVGFMLFSRFLQQFSTFCVILCGFYIKTHLATYGVANDFLYGFKTTAVFSRKCVEFRWFHPKWLKFRWIPPKYWFFNQNRTFSPQAWNHQYSLRNIDGFGGRRPAKVDYLPKMSKMSKFWSFSGNFTHFT